MGMYTEILVHANLLGKTPENVLTLLDWLINDEGEKPETLPDHPFFACSRWEVIARMTSAYFPDPFVSNFSRDDGVYSVITLNVNSNLKNYDGEIGKFFDWINPYVEAADGEFIGYERYEEEDTPILHFKTADTA